LEKWAPLIHPKERSANFALDGEKKGCKKSNVPEGGKTGLQRDKGESFFFIGWEGDWGFWLPQRKGPAYGNEEKKVHLSPLAGKGERALRDGRERKKKGLPDRRKKGYHPETTLPLLREKERRKHCAIRLRRLFRSSGRRGPERRPLKGKRKKRAIKRPSKEIPPPRKKKGQT